MVFTSCRAVLGLHEMLKRGLCSGLRVTRLSAGTPRSQVILTFSYIASASVIQILVVLVNA